MSRSSTSKLALHGGTPAAAANRPDWPPAEFDATAALQHVLCDGTWSHYDGQACRLLAAHLAELHGTTAEQVVLCSSGTVAVELALRGVGLQAGDRVLLAGYDFPGNFRAVEAIGARPVLLDLQSDDWTLDPKLLPPTPPAGTRAVLVSHLHRNVARLPQILEWATAHGLPLVEDTCQAPGAEVHHRVAGSYGRVATLSFGGSKLLTAGRGGALICHDTEVVQRVRSFSERGNECFPLSQLQAAVLLPQLEQLQATNQRRQTAVRAILEGVPARKDCWSWGRPLLPGCAPSYYKLSGLLHCPQVSRDRFLDALRAEGIDAGVGFRGFHLRSHRRCDRLGELPQTQIAAERTVLFHHPILLGDPAMLQQFIVGLNKVIELGCLGRQLWDTHLT